MNPLNEWLKEGTNDRVIQLTFHKGFGVTVQSVYKQTPSFYRADAIEKQDDQTGRSIAVGHGPTIQDALRECSNKLL